MVRQKGAVLIEFLIVAVILLIIIFGGIEYGRLMYVREFAGEGARVAAREAATKPGALVLPATNAALWVDPGVFNENFTCIDLNNLRFPSGAPLVDQDGDGDVDVDDQFAVLPAVHRTLRSTMIRETRDVAGVPRTLLRFRGVLLRNGGAAFDLIVRVPEISGSNATLRRVINPPLAADPMLPTQGLIRMECWKWFNFAVWPFGGAGVANPLVYSNIPPGYAVILIDLDPTSRQGLALRSFGIGRKDIQ
jgi:hypothetical protein